MTMLDDVNSPPARTPDELLARIRALPPHEQLHLAAELLENQRPRIAMAVAAGVVSELEFLRARGVF